MKRSRIDIQLDILHCLNRQGPMKPTRLAYATNLSWRYFVKRMNELMTAEFVKEVPSLEKDKRTIHLYNITDKGRGFLRLMQETKLPFHSEMRT